MIIAMRGWKRAKQEYFPMPWPALKYDTRLDAYRTNMTEDELRGAPKFNRNTDWDWSDISETGTNAKCSNVCYCAGLGV